MTSTLLPDRRVAVKAFAVAAFMASPAAATPHADAALMQAYGTFLTAWEAERALYRSFDIDTAGDAEDQLLNAAVARTMAAGAAVSEIPARTIEGMRCKAHVALYHHGGMRELEKADESGALAAIARDLLAL